MPAYEHLEVRAEDVTIEQEDDGGFVARFKVSDRRRPDLERAVGREDSMGVRYGDVGLVLTFVKKTL